MPMGVLCAHRTTKYVSKISLWNSTRLLGKLQKIFWEFFYAAPCIYCFDFVFFYILSFTFIDCHFFVVNFWRVLKWSLLRATQKLLIYTCTNYTCRPTTTRQFRRLLRQRGRSLTRLSRPTSTKSIGCIGTLNVIGRKSFEIRIHGVTTNGTRVTDMPQNIMKWTKTVAERTNC